jgi:hypothetical protein
MNCGTILKKLNNKGVKSALDSCGKGDAIAQSAEGIAHGVFIKDKTNEEI